MQVELSSKQGRPGEVVSIRVTTDNPAAVASVRLTVGGDLELDLQRSGDGWAGTQAVPWEAPEGTYYLSLRAYDSAWRSIDSAETTFAVLA